MRVKAPAIAIAALVVLAPLTGAALLWCFKLIVDEKLVGRRTVKVSAAQLVELLAQARAGRCKSSVTQLRLAK